MPPPSLPTSTAAPRFHLFTRPRSSSSSSFSIPFLATTTPRTLPPHHHPPHTSTPSFFFSTSTTSHRLSKHNPNSSPNPKSSSSSSSSKSNNPTLPFGSGPSPPRLPESDQKIFEALQRRSTGAFSTPASSSAASDTGGGGAESAATETEQARATLRDGDGDGQQRRIIDTADDGETLHPDLRRGVRPDFEGERNPRTGEIGGPKTEPLRWGAQGEWGYGGRTTDF